MDTNSADFFQGGTKLMGFNLLYHITLLIAYNFQSSLFSIFFSAEQNFAQLENLKAVTGYMFLMSNIYRATHSKHSHCVETAYLKFI